MDFNEAFIILFKNEGTLSIDKNDPGNWTSGAVGHGVLKGSKYGISAATYPDLDIPNLTIDDAKLIYKRDFWDKLKLDRLPNDISFDMFDCAVNAGISRAIKILQTTIDSKPDGIMGQDTISRSNSYGTNLSKHYNANRLLFYTSLKIWDSQGKGWTRRIANNLLLN
jgi:lysozyme family protein